MTKLIVVVFAILCIIGPARGSQIVTLQTSSGKNLPIFLDGVQRPIAPRHWGTR